MSMSGRTRSSLLVLHGLSFQRCCFVCPCVFCVFALSQFFLLLLVCFLSHIELLLGFVYFSALSCLAFVPSQTWKLIEGTSPLKVVAAGQICLYCVPNCCWNLVSPRFCFVCVYFRSRLLFCARLHCVLLIPGAAGPEQVGPGSFVFCVVLLMVCGLCGRCLTVLEAIDAFKNVIAALIKTHFVNDTHASRSLVEKCVLRVLSPVYSPGWHGRFCRILFLSFRLRIPSATFRRAFSFSLTSGIL